MTQGDPRTTRFNWKEETAESSEISSRSITVWRETAETPTHSWEVSQERHSLEGTESELNTDPPSPILRPLPPDTILHPLSFVPISSWEEAFAAEYFNTLFLVLL